MTVGCHSTVNADIINKQHDKVTKDHFVKFSNCGQQLFQCAQKREWLHGDMTYNKITNIQQESVVAR